MSETIESGVVPDPETGAPVGYVLPVPDGESVLFAASPSSACTKPGRRRSSASPRWSTGRRRRPDFPESRGGGRIGDGEP